MSNLKIHHRSVFFMNSKKWLTFKSRWRICFEWINETPSRTWRMKQTHAFSVRTNSSSITRSKSSPPRILKIINGILRFFNKWKFNVPNFCRNDELRLTMSWIGCLLTDSKLFILFAESSQILLKINFQWHWIC